MNVQSLLKKVKKLESSIAAIYEGETDVYFYFEELGESLVLTDSELNSLYDNAELYRKNYDEAKLLKEDAFENLIDSLEKSEIIAHYLFDLIEQGYVDMDGDVHLLAALSTCPAELWKEELA